jgi:GDP-mannose 6-dehydrogenase
MSTIRGTPSKLYSVTKSAALERAWESIENKVMDIFFEDKRLNISPAYPRPGFAFAGSCLPKDLRALNYLSRTLDLSLPILNNIFESNRLLIEHAANWTLSQSRKHIAFLGISFKSGTDDVRESPFVDLIERLIGKGCETRIFDPNVRLAHLVGANREYLNRVLPPCNRFNGPRTSGTSSVRSRSALVSVSRGS